MFHWFESLISLSDPGSPWFWLGVAVLLLGVLLVAVMGLAVKLRLSNNRRSAHWGQVESKRQPQLLDYLAGDLYIDEIHKDLSRRDEPVFIELLARYAGQVQGHERSMIEDLAAPLLSSIAQKASSKKTGIRARAVRLLGILGLPRYRDTIIFALNDSQLPVRMAAAQALIHNPNCQDVEAVLDHLDQFDEVTDNYMSSLLACAGIEAQPYMRIFMAMTDPPPALRAIAARALLLMKDYEAAEMVSEIISPEMPPRLMITCFDILAELGNTTHAQSIRNLLPLNEAPAFAAACRALGQIGNESDLPTLVLGMEDPSPWVNLAAGRALGNLKAVKELEHFLDEDFLRAELAREILDSIIIEQPEEPMLMGDPPAEGLIG